MFPNVQGNAFLTFFILYSFFFRFPIFVIFHICNQQKSAYRTKTASRNVRDSS